MLNVTDNTAKQLYLEENERYMQRLERTQAREIRPILNRQYMDTAKMVAQGQTDRLDFIVDKDRIRFRKVLLKNYRRAATVFSKRAFQIFEQGKEKGLILIAETKTPQDEFWRVLNAWMLGEAGNKIKRIQETTKKNIAKVIQNGLQEEVSHHEIAKRLRKTGLMTNRVRSLKIARTETHTVASKSVDESIASTRMEFLREWYPSLDERVRAAHATMTAHPKVGQKDPFIVGGRRMMYPGDPAGGAANVINCRCVLLYHSKPGIQKPMLSYSPVTPKSKPKLMSSVGKLAECVINGKVCD